MGLIDTGTIKVSDGGVDPNFKLGGGQNAATRAVLQGPEHYNAMPSFAPMPDFNFSSNQPFAALGGSSSGFAGGYTDAMWHRDLQAWGWENAPESGYMN